MWDKGESGRLEETGAPRAEAAERVRQGLGPLMGITSQAQKQDCQSPRLSRLLSVLTPVVWDGLLSAMASAVGHKVAVTSQFGTSQGAHGSILCAPMLPVPNT